MGACGVWRGDEMVWYTTNAWDVSLYPIVGAGVCLSGLARSLGHCSLVVVKGELRAKVLLHHNINIPIIIAMA